MVTTQRAMQTSVVSDDRHAKRLGRHTALRTQSVMAGVFTVARRITLLTIEEAAEWKSLNHWANSGQRLVARHQLAPDRYGQYTSLSPVLTHVRSRRMQIHSQ